MIVAVERDPISERLIVRAVSGEHWRAARALVEAYAASLPVDLSFQDFDRELAHLADEYGPPAGACFLADVDGGYRGCIALRRFGEATAEIKRLYVSPDARGRGIGRRLVERVVSEAKQLGYARAVLDTLPSMTEARALYESMGFHSIEPYRFNPVAGTAFLELVLDAARTDPPT